MLEARRERCCWILISLDINLPICFCYGHANLWIGHWLLDEEIRILHANTLFVIDNEFFTLYFCRCLWFGGVENGDFAAKMGISLRKWGFAAKMGNSCENGDSWRLHCSVLRRDSACYPFGVFERWSLQCVFIVLYLPWSILYFGCLPLSSLISGEIRFCGEIRRATLGVFERWSLQCVFIVLYCLGLCYSTLVACLFLL